MVSSCTVPLRSPPESLAPLASAKASKPSAQSSSPRPLSSLPVGSNDGGRPRATLDCHGRKMKDCCGSAVIEGGDTAGRSDQRDDTSGACNFNNNVGDLLRDASDNSSVSDPLLPPLAPVVETSDVSNNSSGRSGGDGCNNLFSILPPLASMLEINATQIPFHMPLIDGHFCGIRCNHNDATSKDSIISFMNSALGNAFPAVSSHENSPVNQSLMECIVYLFPNEQDAFDQVCLFLPFFLWGEFHYVVYYLALTINASLVCIC